MFPQPGPSESAEQPSIFINPRLVQVMLDAIRNSKLCTGSDNIVDFLLTKSPMGVPDQCVSPPSDDSGTRILPLCGSAISNVWLPRGHHTGRRGKEGCRGTFVS